MITTSRRFGWSIAGTRAHKAAPFVRGDRLVLFRMVEAVISCWLMWTCLSYSVLPGITLTGIIWMSVVLGAFNGSTFLDFVDGLLEQMNPYPQPKSVLVMDNCSIHHVEGVAERCAQKYVDLVRDIHSCCRLTYVLICRGVRLVYLPPYSPDFNPIEEMFSAFKAFIRRNGQEYRRIMLGRDRALINQILHAGLHAVATAESCRGWFRMYLVE